MTHLFEVDIAVKTSVNAAILYQSIQFWCAKNEANEKHFHDNRYWTYNSVSAWSELFPYLGESAIKTALSLLTEHELIKVGKYNENPYDHTKWYSAIRLGENSQSTLDENDQSSLSVSKTYINGIFNEIWKEHDDVIHNKAKRKSSGRKGVIKIQFADTWRYLAKKYPDTLASDMANFIYTQVQATWEQASDKKYYTPNLDKIIDKETLEAIIDKEMEDE